MTLNHIADRARTEQSLPMRGFSRRAFLRAAAAAGGGLTLSVRLPFAGGEAVADADGFAPNAFIRIDRDGQIVLIMPYVEMGQGTYTAVSMLIAEELEVDLKQIRVEHAPPNDKLYGNPLLAGVQATGGSTSMRAAWKPMREAGAAARTMLILAAARHWNVDPSSCSAQSAEVIHGPTGRRFKYAELAADAAGVPVPESVALKHRQSTPPPVGGRFLEGRHERPKRKYYKA
jgi:isoquinoline 1-oxidoreductase subunit beta